ncbi:MAG TPA: metallopeptidase TldD-related protein [Anaerolineales bacterium]|nr:metallopeptidase TldD-related protein [Anaerolineales bacterium]
MLNKIVEALKGRNDLAGWTVRHLITRGGQVYAVPGKIESQRAVDVERYKVDVLRQTSTPDGKQAVGSGDVTLLPGDDIQAAIENAILTAGLVANPVHTLPAPGVLPDVPLIDTNLQKDAAAVTKDVIEHIRAAAQNQEVHLTAAECFGEIHTTHLVNSRGIDAEQESTQIDIEFVLHSQRGESDVETFTEMSRRRVADLQLEDEIEQRMQHTLDLFEAGSPPEWQGPVVLRGKVLETFMAGDSLRGGVLHTLGSAASKYAKISPWEIGKSVFRGEVKGDPLTVWANRCLPFGINSNRFDEEGLPAQRVELIRDNELVSFSASQRYADYLNLPATGAFGGVELPSGKLQASALLAEPYVEIIQFSWFNPDLITGDFATEIRLGYLVENGIRKPFRGGQLIGNYLDALANVHWSAETGFFGNYLGPHTARFNDLKIAGQGN